MTGGTGAETMIGGDGADSFTPVTGNDSLSGGAGNDTFTFSSTDGLTAADTVDGGAGTDTLTASDIQSDYAGTLTGIPVLALDFEADGTTFSVANASGVSVLSLTGDADNRTATISAIADGTTVRMGDANLIATVDTVAGASLTIDARADSDEALTITDAKSVTYVNGSEGTDTDMASTVLDATDTTSLTVTGRLQRVTRWLPVILLDQCAVLTDGHYTSNGCYGNRWDNC